MKRKRILSLLLTLTVMATMLMAVPLTVSAAITLTDEVETLDSSKVYTFTYDDYYLTDNGTLATSDGTAQAYTKLANGLLYCAGTNTNESKLSAASEGMSSTYGYYYAGANGDSGKCALVFKTSVAGVVSVKAYLNMDNDNTDTSKYCVGVYYINSSNSRTSNTPSLSTAKTLTTFSYDVEAGSTVYVTNRGYSEVEIYEIDFTVPEPTVTADDIDVTIGGSAQIVPSASNFTNNDNVTFSYAKKSGDDGITVNEDGLVTAENTVTPGTEAVVTVTATESDVGESATCDVTVTAKNLTYVTKIEVADTSVEMGKTTTLSASVEPTDASDSSVTWSIEDESIATIDSSTGVVTGIAAGTATVTATANDSSGVTGTATITVTEPAYTNSYFIPTSTTEDGYIIYNSDVKVLSDAVDGTSVSNGISGGPSFGDKTYSNSLQVRNDSGKGCAILYVTPTYDGTLVMTYRRQSDQNGTSADYTQGDNKDVRVYDSSSTKQTASYYNSTMNDDESYRVVRAAFDVTCGETYTIYGTGTTIQLLELDYTKAVDDTWYLGSDWNIKKDSTSGEITSVTAPAGEAGLTYEGKSDVVKVESMNMFTNLDTAIDSGVYYINVNAYLDGDSSTSDGFRIYLENESATTYQVTDDSLGVFSQVVFTDSAGSNIYTGSTSVSTTDSNRDKYTSSYSASETGWYNFLIILDYDSEDSFITLETTTPNGTVYTDTMSAISGASTDLKQIRLITRGSNSYFTVSHGTYVFGDSETDSGYYTSGDQNVGVIRFLQEFIGVTTDVTEYGFYFIDGDGKISTYNVEKSTTEQELDGGFYGDLTGIDGYEDADATIYSAKPYVIIGSETDPFYGVTISGSVDWTTEVSDYGTSASDAE